MKLVQTILLFLKFVESYLGKKKVPALCNDPNLAPYGACRVCSV